MFNFFKDKKVKTVGLALSSGGFRGPAHIAVIKTLIKNGIPIDYISGSSIGALIGAHYALFQDLDKLEIDMFKQQTKKYLHLRDFGLRQGFLSGNTFENSFVKMFGKAKFSDTKIPLSLVATDLISGDPVILKEGDITQAVRASISIPVAFKPVKKNQNFLIDGGLSIPVPDSIVKKMGADIVISVNLYHRYNLSEKRISMAKATARSLEIFLTNMSHYSINNSDIVINPDVSKYSELSRLKTYFSPEIAKDIMKIAEKETLKAIPKIKKLLNK
jgi:NTE family protein